ncbi:terpene synthase family protein [Streptomyces clavifer]|uniref:terpene synthase family protein n=1 Tax=Streptomyces clavifer TaxID=68188 RepID=UPI00364A5FB2
MEKIISNSVPVIEVPLPVLTRLLPPARPYPDGEAIRSAAQSFWSAPDARRLLPGPAARDAYQAQRAHEFTLWCYPDLLKERLPLVVAMNEFAYAADFVFDNTDAGEAMMTAESGGQLAGEGIAAYVEVFAGLVRQAETLLSPRQHERLLAATAAAFECLGTHRDAGLRQQSSQEIHRRHLDAGGTWVAGLVIEMAVGVDMSDHFSNESLLKEFYRAGYSACLLVNDVFSLRKEYHWDGGLSNTIPALARERGTGLGEAVTAVAQWALAEEQRCYDLRDRILSTPQGGDPGVRAFITAVEDFMAGDLLWHRISPRYHGKGFQYDGTTGGTMVLNPDRTLYRPACPAAPTAKEMSVDPR